MNLRMIPDTETFFFFVISKGGRIECLLLSYSLCHFPRSILNYSQLNMGRDLHVESILERKFGSTPQFIIPETSSIHLDIKRQFSRYDRLLFSLCGIVIAKCWSRLSVGVTCVTPSQCNVCSMVDTLVHKQVLHSAPIPTLNICQTINSRNRSWTVTEITIQIVGEKPIPSHRGLSVSSYRER